MSSEGDLPAAPVTPQLQYPQEPAETRFLRWSMSGAQGMRVGWLAAGFLLVNFIATGIYAAVAERLIAFPMAINWREFSPGSAALIEIVSFLALLTATALSALVERRSILDYNLRDQRRGVHFAAGMVAGVLTLSLLITALHGGGWLRFEGASLHGVQVGQFGLLWGGVFLLTGLTEEGTTRGYLLFTLSRGINFWWAAGTVTFLCLLAALNSQGYGTAGIYAVAALGMPVCLVLHLRRSPEEGFWDAAWLTSALFGYLHTFNRGESGVGIFSTGLIGFAFCVSVRVTGSAWWAIGFHAAWDWAQTFLFGTADSGLAPKDHLFTTVPVGASLWSGGTAGPEGSVLMIPLIGLLLLALVAVYGRGQREQSTSPAALPRIS